VGTYSGNNLKTVTDPATGAVNLQMADNPEFTSVKTGNTTINDSGLTINGGPSITTAGIDAGGKVISNVAPGVAGTDAVNVDQLTAVDTKVDNVTNTVNNFAGDQSTTNTTINGRGIRYVRTNDTGVRRRWATKRSRRVRTHWLWAAMPKPRRTTRWPLVRTARRRQI